jgi:hypothetical protein
MSFLTPLYILGLAAVSLPILFHLIRRTPKGMQPFSTLMFVTPSPPRVTRRSRLDQILLLLLRAAALILLALAFARPFWRQTASVDLSDQHGRWIAVLADTSASMQREGLWKKARNELRQILNGLGPADRVALYQFDEQVNRVLSFDEFIEVPAPERERLVLQRFDELGTTWGGTSLGAALIQAADDLDASVAKKQPLASRQIIVLSDLQSGCDIETLQGYQWPETVQTTANPIVPEKTSNASLQLLDDLTTAEDRRGVRVRVANAEDSVASQFTVAWNDLEGKRLGSVRSISVPPGESRVVRLPLPPANQNASGLRLNGDDHDFDNRHYVVPPRLQEARVVYVGDDNESDPEGLLYYLNRGLTNDPWNPVHITIADPSEEWLPRVTRSRTAGNTNTGGIAVPASRDTNQEDNDQRAIDLPPHLVIVTQPLNVDQIGKLKAYAASGGTVLYVVHGTGVSVEQLKPLLSDSLNSVQAVIPDDYVLLSEIDFQHPLFSPFSNPRYSDFSKIHFWQYHQLEFAAEEGLSVLARFDNGAPALLERPLDKGRFLVLTAGWQPENSELARSSKFVPLMSRMISDKGLSNAITYFVHQSIPRPPESINQRTIVTGPDGTEWMLAEQQSAFVDANQPGVYSTNYGNTSYDFAVNLLPSESKTSPLDVAQLEQRGVRLGKIESHDEMMDAERQMRDIELESQQSYWQWLIAAALVAIVLESTVAGRRTLQSPEEAVA